MKKVFCLADMTRNGDEALRVAHRYAGDAPLTIGCALPSVVGFRPLFPGRIASDVTAELENQVYAQQAVTDRALAVTGRQADDVEVFVDLDGAEGFARRAEAEGAELIVIPGVASCASDVLRASACSVLVARENDGEDVVLAATDLSDPTMPALDTAVHEARDRHASLVVVHAADLAGVATPRSTLGVPMSRGADAITAFSGRAFLAGARETMRSALNRLEAAGHIVVVGGPPGETILLEAERSRAQLVVVATEDRGTLERFAFGSVAEQVANAASCSVMIVRKRRPLPC